MQYRAPACNRRPLASKQLLCFIAVLLSVQLGTWNKGTCYLELDICHFLINNTMLKLFFLSWTVWLSIQPTPWGKIFNRVYYSSLTASNLTAHSSWQCVIWLAYKPHWEPDRWGLKLFLWLAGWGAVSRQRCWVSVCGDVLFFCEMNRLTFCLLGE